MNDIIWRNKMFEVKFFENMQYLVRYPEGYSERKKYPVILFLHGAGSRGTNIDVLRKNDFFTVTEYLEEKDFVCVAPMCHEETWFDLFQTLKEFADAVSQEPFCKSGCFYAVGHSMGAYGVWQLAMSMPWLFAAIIPICGGGMYWNAARLKNVAVWAFHGENDTVVKPEESMKMVDAVNAHGGEARLTVFEGVGHNSWCDVYGDAEVFAWLFSHVK